ncbi:carbohydrate-binding domain-containing protein [Enterococcus sp. AZ192]|uniref:carbohydrate-binding domain-containing protein n=1 Tax=unclassified Enterococcus TaxID=2608891 RepID=UPI003D280EF3
MKRKKLSSALVILILMTLAGCDRQASNTDEKTTTDTSQQAAKTVAQATQTSEIKYGSYDDEDFEESYNEAKATNITLKNSGTEIDGSGASEKDGSIVITAGGTYVFSGDYNGQVRISAKDEVVHLVLNNANITNDSSSAIYVEQAQKVITTLVDDSNNSLSDGANYTFPSSDVTEPDAVFFSKDDLTINGSGTLNVTGNYSNGIRSKDDLIITNGTINVTAKNNALKGKDSVSIADGTFSLKTSEGDGIQANNATDAEKGWIAIDGGKINIQSGNDGIQAETNLSISTGDITIQTADGYDDSAIDTTKSYKGLKAAGNIIVDSGTFDLNTADDSIHANAAVTINNGTFSITSGDDGIHADTDLLINNGKIKVSQSYEGLEGATVTIKDGDISVKASDDGINAAGGSANENEQEGPFGTDSFGGPDGAGDSTKFIEISGGTVFVDAQGDGVDSNGDIRMTEGTLIVNGPLDSGNAALDYDGSFTIDGGTFIASGSSGMAMSASDSSSQASLSIYFDETKAAGTLINVKDETGKTIVSVAPAKDFSHIAISSPNLKVGETVTLSIDGEDSGTMTNGVYQDGNYSNGTQLTSISIDDVLTSVDQSGNEVSGNQMGGGQPPM